MVFYTTESLQNWTSRLFIGNYVKMATKANVEKGHQFTSRYVASVYDLHSFLPNSNIQLHTNDVQSATYRV